MKLKVAAIVVSGLMFISASAIAGDLAPVVPDTVQSPS